MCVCLCGCLWLLMQVKHNTLPATRDVVVGSCLRFRLNTTRGALPFWPQLCRAQKKTLGQPRNQFAGNRHTAPGSSSSSSSSSTRAGTTLHSIGGAKRERENRAAARLCVTTHSSPVKRVSLSLFRCFLCVRAPKTPQTNRRRYGYGGSH